MKKTILTLKQIEILTLLYRFRFLNRLHLQKLLNHKNRRRINIWLKNLCQNEYIGRIYSRKLKENTKPAIYFLKTKSVSVLKKQPNIDQSLLKRIYGEKLRSKKFIKHSLFLADIYFNLKKLCKDKKAKLHFFTKTDLSLYDYLPHPVPDLYLMIKDSQGDSKRYFLEVFAKKTPRYALRHRILRFFDFNESNEWEVNTHHPFPTILLVCADKFMQRYLNKFIPEAIEDEDNDNIQFFLTTTDKINKNGVGTEVWKQAYI